jgi:hypothetical protein
VATAPDFEKDMPSATTTMDLVGLSTHCTVDRAPLRMDGLSSALGVQR